MRTFAGHGDARASQAYDVLVAYAAEPGRFVKVGAGEKKSSGGMSVVKVPVQADRAVAVRLEFRNGPEGFNVYREINVLGNPSR